MSQLTDKEKEKGFLLWRGYYFERFRNVKTLKEARESLQLPAATVAKRIGISTTAYQKLEKSAEKETISVQTLKRSAEALGCEVIIQIRPKGKKTFSEVIWQRLLPESLKSPWLKSCDPKRKANALAAVARDKMMEPDFRRKSGWTKQKN